VPRPAWEVADLLRTLAQQGQLPSLSSAQAKVVGALTACRTAALGGHVDACDDCGHQTISYNSCRNRHCPKCQGRAAAEWLDAQRKILLPVPYAHVVFTLPDLLAPLALQNPHIVYSLLFRAASQTLLQVAATPRHLGARLGFLAILHTWGQNLLHHPHLHCVVPAGGLAPDGSRWISCRPGFFLPVRVLSRLFRGKFLALLEEAQRAGKLQYHGQLHELRQPHAFRSLCAQARAREWVVYAKPPFGGPDCVLKYLARYTHRIAISNHRILSLSQDQVSFTWKDYKHGHRQRVMTLDSTEFARRFLLHVLPHGFVKIRYYGTLAQSQRSTGLARCSELLKTPAEEPASSITAASQPEARRVSKLPLCPRCQRASLRRLHTVPIDSS
jgi:putative transposase/transposase-like zinc-binding protein